MNLYFAPFEGISGYVYRNAYNKYFGSIDKYFIPFIMPNQFGHLNYKEINDILPEHNEGMKAVPQLLTNNADDFLNTVKEIEKYGYDEVNLNVGCPSKTVVTKYKGAGLLADTVRLDKFLQEIYKKSTVKISIKTRIGMNDPEEVEDIIKIYNKYPVSELIVHPRLQTDYYKNTPDLEAFKYILDNSSLKICYNGDVFTSEDYDNIKNKFENLDSIMLGRGILKNPGLGCYVKNGEEKDKSDYINFHDYIYDEYKNVLYGEKTVLFKMKELWSYLGNSFTSYDKYGKKIKKAQTLKKYDEVIEDLFKEQDIIKIERCKYGMVKSD